MHLSHPGGTPGSTVDPVVLEFGFPGTSAGVALLEATYGGIFLKASVGPSEPYSLKEPAGLFIHSAVPLPAS